MNKVQTKALSSGVWLMIAVLFISQLGSMFCVLGELYREFVFSL